MQFRKNIPFIATGLEPRRFIFPGAGFVCKWPTMVGLELDCEGITFSPCNAPDFRITNLTIRDRKIDMAITGRGWKIGKLWCNGRKIQAPFTIPFQALSARNVIRLMRTA